MQPKRKRPGMNRPDGGHTLLTHEVLVKLIHYMTLGIDINLICPIVGIDRGTWYSWINQGKARPEHYAQFNKLYVVAKILGYTHV